MTMGQRIAEQRKRLGFSQESLGEKLEVSRQAVSKWEADGTIPEIDKLVAMSKLFDVSVGWLLGVEEEKPDAPEVTPEPRQESLSEEQLKLIEGIVAKYQTQPEKKRSKVPLILCGIASLLAVILAIRAMDMVNTNNHNYDGQLSNLFSNYSNLQGQLREVSQQLNELAQGERLLTDYSVSAVGNDDLNGAVVSFSGTPRAWQAEDTAYLSARFEDREVERAECVWDGSLCTAQMELSARDGYSYYYILCHTDGSQEQQALDIVYHYAVNIAEGLTISGYAEIPVLYDDGVLMLFHTFVDVTVPPLLESAGTVTWTEATATLYQNGREFSRQDLLAGADMEDSYYDGGSYLNRVKLWEVSDIPVKDGDEITVWVEAKTNTGIVISQEVYSGVRKGDSYTENATSQLYIQ